MKFESDQVICCETAGHKPISNPYEYDNKNKDFTVLKSGNGALKENQDEGLKGREGNANCLQYEMGFENEQSQTGSKVDFLEEEEVQYFDTQSVSSHSSLKLESLENPVFYMDKNVMERELPELMVCYEENVYHVVKDICIDDGVPSKGRFWFDADDDEKISNKLVSGEKDMNNVIVKENVDVNKTVKENVELPVENGLKSSIEKEESCLHFPVSKQKKPLEEKHFKHEISLDCVHEDIMPTEDAEDDARKTSTHDDGMVSLGYLLSMPEFMDEKSNPKSSMNNSDVVEQPPMQCQSETELSPAASDCKEFTNGRDGITLETPSVSGEELKSGHGEGTLEATALNSETQKADDSPELVVLPSVTMNPVPEKSENSREKAELPNQSLHSVSEKSDNATSDESSCNRSEETRNIALDVNPCEAAASNQKQCPQNGSSDHLDARISSKLDSSNFESASNHLHYNHGESSFSAAVPASGSITYSGPIAYSGSLSLRSDSSTTSTRSFAFPVLQSEWCSSPVRMAKADRRRAKHRSWRQGLLCCRF